LAYNFNDDPVSGSPPDAGAASGAAPAPAPHPSGEGGGTAEAPLSIGTVRFNSCRWQQPKDENTAAFCTHREVKPYAGTTGFDPDAWCPECQYYKLRRAPKKRNPNEDYSY
jgi:hypothetical protein